MEQLKPKIGDAGQSNRFDPSRSIGPEASVDEGALAGDKSPIQNQELRKKLNSTIYSKQEKSRLAFMVKRP